MSEKPILMTSENYRKCQDGTKTQTRRVIVPQPKWIACPNVPFKTNDADPNGVIKCPYPVGTRLWVKESVWYRDDDGLTWYEDGQFRTHPTSIMGPRLLTPKDREDKEALLKDLRENGFKKRSPRFMWKWQARLWEDVTAVRVERLQDISYDDVIAEGVWRPDWAIDYTKDMKYPTWKQAWVDLWDSINKDRAPWSSNPWVWVYTFRRVDK